MAKRRPYAPRVPKEERRAQVLDAALEVIARDGYAGVSIDAVAREAGLSRPVIYGVFDDLGALLTALLDRQEKRALAQLMSAIPAVFDPDDIEGLVAGTVRGMLDAVMSDPLTWRPILAPADGTPPAVRKRIERDRDLVRQRIEGLVTTGLAIRGGAEVDAEVVSHALIGTAEYFGRMVIEEPERIEPERIVATVSALLLALAGPSGRD